ncbi:MAG TPA: glucose-6-phosphate isomerase, partial [Rhodocyclaceae bacterium]|nr:glucose-6-phosphate isomerase [Rhodocyclaceae bacterium]
MMPIDNTPTAAAWKTVQEHAERLRHRHLRELFADDPQRTAGLSVERAGLLVDFSKQRIDRAALDALVELARAADVEAWRDRMFAGEPINVSENRAVLHAALRHRGAVFPRPDFDVMPAVRTELERMTAVAQQLRGGQWKGYSGQPIRHVVNIGIGGSDLGPRMATRALQALGHPTLSVHYVSNIDGAGLAPLLSTLDPRCTLF